MDVTAAGTLFLAGSLGMNAVVIGHSRISQCPAFWRFSFFSFAPVAGAPGRLCVSGCRASKLFSDTYPAGVFLLSSLED